MNNKGQTLVLFILLIPVVFIVVFLLINYGMLASAKSKAKNNIEYSIKYGLSLYGKAEEDSIMSNSDIENKVMYILSKNLDSKYIKNVNVTDNEIIISVEYTLDNSFSIDGANSFKCSMTGRIVEDKYVIEGC